MHMEWWMWVVASFFLLILEILVPGVFFFFFLGVGALLAGLAGLFLEVSGEWRWAIFSVGSIAGLVFLSGPMRRKFQRSKVAEVLHEEGRSLEDIELHALGKVEYQGSPWDAKNAGKERIARGDRVVVLSQENLQITVRKQ